MKKALSKQTFTQPLECLNFDCFLSSCVLGSSMDVLYRKKNSVSYNNGTRSGLGLQVAELYTEDTV